MNLAGTNGIPDERILINGFLRSLGLEMGFRRRWLLISEEGLFENYFCSLVDLIVS